MSDEKPPMPQQPATKELPKPTQAELQLAEILSLSRATRADVVEVKDDVVKMNGTIELLQSDAKLTKEEFRVRFVGLEGRISELETARTRNSERAKNASKTDLEHDAKLAEEIIARKAVEAQLAEEKAKREEDKTKLEKLASSMVTKDDLARITEGQTNAIVQGVMLAAKNPMVRKIGWAFAGLVLVAINAAATYLAAKGH